jgi:threonine dehydrogenase-like Zn-dependent dehydrogenase
LNRMPTAAAVVRMLYREIGQLTLLGNVTPEIPINLQEIINQEVNIRGSFTMSNEVDTCLTLLRQRRTVVKPLISRGLPLEEGPAAFASLNRAEPGLVKILLQP